MFTVALAHLRCNEIPKKKGKQEQQNSDPVASQMFSSVLVDIHVVKLSSIVLGHVHSGEKTDRQLTGGPATWPYPSKHLVADQVSDNLGS